MMRRIRECDLLSASRQTSRKDFYGRRKALPRSVGIGSGLTIGSARCRRKASLRLLSHGLYRATLVPRLACLGLLLSATLGRADDWPQWRGPNRDGVSAETGVIMLLYLDQAWSARRRAGARSARDLYEAIVEGAALRLRPKMMTVITIVAGLLPIFWGHGAGSTVMRRIAAPMVGGMVSATVLTLVVIPVVYSLWQEWAVVRPATAAVAVGNAEAAGAD